MSWITLLLVAMGIPFAVYLFVTNHPNPRKDKPASDIETRKVLPALRITTPSIFGWAGSIKNINAEPVSVDVDGRIFELGPYELVEIGEVEPPKGESDE